MVRVVSACAASTGSGSIEFSSFGRRRASRRQTRAHDWRDSAACRARLAGQAVTIRLVRDEAASATEAGLAAIRVLESGPPGSVIVAALDGDSDHAVFGATFAAVAKAHKLSGFVVDGAVRDLADLKQMTFPTWARSAAPGTAGGHYRSAGRHGGGGRGRSRRRASRALCRDPGCRAKMAEREAGTDSTDRKKNGSYLKALQERKGGAKRQ